MNNYEINFKWVKECEGFVTIEANSMEEAMEKLTQNKALYTKLAENLYRGYNESISLNEIRVTKENANVIEEVEYTTVWDGGHIITTTATYDVTSGRIIDIKPASINESESVTNLEHEYITRVDGTDMAVFSINSKYNHVTADYIKNLLEEAIAVHGESYIELARDEEDNCYVRYSDNTTAFDYNKESFCFKNEKAWDEVKELCESLCLPVSECW